MPHMDAPAHVQKHIDVWEIAHTNQTFDFTFLIHHCLCWIKPILMLLLKQTANVDYQIEVTLTSILILKAIDST